MPKEKRTAASAPVTERSLSWFKPAEYNPRKDLQPGEKDYEALKRSIQEYGHVQTLVANKDGTLIGGHQTLKVLKDLGYTKARAVVLDLSEKKEKALNIALNKISGDWDKKKLASLLVELDDGSDAADLTGFGEEEIRELVDGDAAGGAVDARVPFTEELGEANNYIVLTFKTEMDFMMAEELLGLGEVKSIPAHGGPLRTGLGRVLPGPESIEKIKAAAR